MSKADIHDVSKGTRLVRNSFETPMRRSRFTLYICVLLAVCVFSVLQNMNILSRLIATPTGVEPKTLSTVARASTLGSLRRIPAGRCNKSAWYLARRFVSVRSARTELSVCAQILQILFTSASQLGGLSPDFTSPSRTTTIPPSLTSAH